MYFIILMNIIFFFKSYEYIIGKINHHVQLGVYNLGDIQDIITSNLDKKQEEEEFFSITRKLEKKLNHLEKI